MARRYGNTSGSSLIRAARAAWEKKAGLEDQIAEFDWQLSAKTADDFAALQAHYQTRITRYSTINPSKALSYEKKIVSANRTYVSNEIQRAQIDVLEGDMSLQDKYDVLISLYKRAVDNGDLDLAQNLYQQAATLDVQIQREAEAARTGGGGGGGSASAAASRGLTAQKNELTVLQKAIEDSYKTGKPLTDINGKVIKGRFENGQLIEDPNGQPIRFNDRNYRQAIGIVMKNLEETLREYVNSGMDANGSAERQYYTLVNSGNFRKFAGDEALERANRGDGGEDPYITEIDPITGERRIKAKKVVGQETIGTDEFGNPIIANSYLDRGRPVGSDGKAGNTYMFERDLDMIAGGDREDYRTKLLTEEGSGRSYYIDPVTGKRLYVNETGQRSIYGFDEEALSFGSLPYIKETSRDKLFNLANTAKQGIELAQDQVAGATGSVIRAAGEVADDIEAGQGIVGGLAGRAIGLGKSAASRLGAFLTGKQKEYEARIAQEKRNAEVAQQQARAKAEQTFRSGIAQRQAQLTAAKQNLKKASVQPGPTIAKLQAQKKLAATKKKARFTLGSSEFNKTFFGDDRPLKF